MANNLGKSYRRFDSPFYKLRSKKRLAKLLRVSGKNLKNLAASENMYVEFTMRKSNGGLRSISAPLEHLKVVQSRIASLIRRIETPDYLYSPALGRSYVDNAACHLGSSTIQKFDIARYFPNCKDNKVIWFFHKKMQCSRDVAAILRGIVTHRKSLPQGSPCSPILAFHCYKDMWDEIYESVQEYNCRMSLYVDDLTVSGNFVPGHLVWEIERILHRHGHLSNSKKRKKALKGPIEITGVIVDQDRLVVPNRQHKKLYDVRMKLRSSTCTSQQMILKQRLNGRQAQFRQIVDRSGSKVS